MRDVTNEILEVLIENTIISIILAIGLCTQILLSCAILCSRDRFSPVNVFILDEVIGNAIYIVTWIILSVLAEAGITPVVIPVANYQHNSPSIIAMNVIDSINTVCLVHYLCSMVSVSIIRCQRIVSPLRTMGYGPFGEKRLPSICRKKFDKSADVSSDTCQSFQVIGANWAASFIIGGLIEFTFIYLDTTVRREYWLWQLLVSLAEYVVPLAIIYIQYARTRREIQCSILEATENTVAIDFGKAMEFRLVKANRMMYYVYIFAFCFLLYHIEYVIEAIYFSIYYDKTGTTTPTILNWFRFVSRCTAYSYFFLTPLVVFVNNPELGENLLTWRKRKSKKKSITFSNNVTMYRSSQSVLMTPDLGRSEARPTDRCCAKRSISSDGTGKYRLRLSKNNIYNSYIFCCICSVKNKIMRKESSDSTNHAERRSCHSLESQSISEISSNCDDHSLTSSAASRLKDRLASAYDIFVVHADINPVQNCVDQNVQDTCDYLAVKDGIKHPQSLKSIMLENRLTKHDYNVLANMAKYNHAIRKQSNERSRSISAVLLQQDHTAPDIITDEDNADVKRTDCETNSTVQQQKKRKISDNVVDSGQKFRDLPRKQQSEVRKAIFEDGIDNLPSSSNEYQHRERGHRRVISGLDEERVHFYLDACVDQFSFDEF